MLSLNICNKIKVVGEKLDAKLGSGTTNVKEIHQTRICNVTCLIIRVIPHYSCEFLLPERNQIGGLLTVGSK